MEKLKKANELDKKIKALEKFLDTIVTNDGANSSMGLFFNIETTKKLKIFGFRGFMIGKHEANISVPMEVKKTVINEAQKLLEQSYKELDELFTETNL